MEIDFGAQDKMSFLRNLFKKKIKQATITICGLDKAGKTTIVRFLLAGEHKDTFPTMGVNREVIALPHFELDIFDLGGQEDFRPMWSEINEQSDGLIYVVDSTDHFRLQESKEIFHTIISTQIRKHIPILILLNKFDLDNRINRTEFVKEFALINLDLTWACFDTSALTGQGLYDSFEWFINQLQESNIS